MRRFCDADCHYRIVASMASCISFSILSACMCCAYCLDTLLEALFLLQEGCKDSRERQREQARILFFKNHSPGMLVERFRPHCRCLRVWTFYFGFVYSARKRASNELDDKKMWYNKKDDDDDDDAVLVDSQKWEMTTMATVVNSRKKKMCAAVGETPVWLWGCFRRFAAGRTHIDKSQHWDLKLKFMLSTGLDTF